MTAPLTVVITQGDPRGVGPELILRLAARGLLTDADRVVGDPAAFEALSTSLGGWAREGWEIVRPLFIEGSRAGLGQYRALELGVDAVLDRPGAALLTAPIDKAVSAKEGLAHPGHTEYLAERAGGVDVAMLMAGPRLRVVPVTVHIPLASVPRTLSAVAIEKAGALLGRALVERFGIERPRVGVLGLNPHAGEGGLLGDEESRIIAPAIDALRRAQPEVVFEGPLPADTAFYVHLQGELDGLVAMYHDQALAPFKLLHFQDGVNMTLGLSFVRTSPDHGTAKDIAGKGVADASSMEAALRMARGPSR